VPFTSSNYSCLQCSPGGGSSRTNLHRIAQNECYVHDVIFSTVGSFLKLTANFTYIQMSLNRYMLIGKEHSAFLQRLASFSIRKTTAFNVITALLLSSIIVFQQFFSTRKSRCPTTTHSRTITKRSTRTGIRMLTSFDWCVKSWNFGPT
jgi:hypothetical protein